ncbi:response regulator receiver domain-containing protein [Flavobacteriaceae bacterium MAR_2009_75]|nr:response regulator receiver domain-containing protein [Flavobacteriaceae bacterium MAR_2009_75]
MKIDFSNICIIDDDAIAIFGIKRALAKLHPSNELNIAIFENGEDALEGFELRSNNGEKLPSLIFVDLNMPIMNGWDFLDEFTETYPERETWPDIFIMSSSINPEDYEKAKTYNLEKNYLTKPVDKKLLEKVFS